MNSSEEQDGSVHSLYEATASYPSHIAASQRSETQGILSRDTALLR